MNQQSKPIVCQACGAKLDPRNIWRGHRFDCKAWDLALKAMIEKAEGK
jgi:hypothetical protein